MFLAAGSPDAETLPRGKKARLSGPATRRDLERMYEAFDEVLERVAEDAQLVLSEQLRHSILQVVHG